MKRKLLHKKTSKTLKSLLKNLCQRRDGILKKINKEKGKLRETDKVIEGIEFLVDQKNDEE